MKVIVNRKALVGVLKALRELSKEASKRKDTAKYSDNIVLSAQNGTFNVMVAIGTAFITSTVDAEVEEEGSCQVSYRLYELAKLAKDDFISLKFNKTLVLTGESSFRASLTENVDTRIPFERVLAMANDGTSHDLCLITEELEYLIDVSKAFPPIKEIYYVNIKNDEEGTQGSVQPSEYGLLESFPMQGEGAEVEVRMDSYLLKATLTFCGSRATVGQLVSAPGFSMVYDPDNPTWFAIIGRLVTEQDKHESQ